MIGMSGNSRLARLLIVCLAGIVALTACVVPAVPVQVSNASPLSPTTITTTETITTLEQAQTIEITVQSQASQSNVKITVGESGQVFVPEPAIAESTEFTPAAPIAIEPIIFTGIAIGQKCGHADVVAADGHGFYATPRLLPDSSNLLAHLPEGARVEIIDCMLWTDRIDVSWLAVRTSSNKLGWMIVQPDKLYVTLYPVVLQPARPASGVPAGAQVAYIPPSGCSNNDVSTGSTATSIGIDFIPVVGDLKGLYEAGTGCDMVTGESLGDWRWLGLLGIIGLSEVALLRHGDEAADVASIVGKTGELRYGDELADSVRMADDLDVIVREGDEVAAAVGRNADDAADIARAAGKIDDFADALTNSARATQDSAALSDDALKMLSKFEQPCSFSVDTLVSTHEGSIPISLIETGDLVLAYNEAIDTVGYYTVTAAFAHYDPIILNLTIGEEIIETTPEHPFFVDGEWMPAGKIAIGDMVLSADGFDSPVRRVEAVSRTQVMYNLTVAEAHTYFVGSGEWLVHNACSRILRKNLDVPTAWDENNVAWQAHHIIPGEFETKHNFVKRAKAGGWAIDGADNGVGLPYLDEVAEQYNLPAHRGSHSNYSSEVRVRLDELEDIAIEENWSNTRAAEELSVLVEELRGKIWRRPAGQRLN